MSFKREEVEKLLAECGRRCCICHRFCGVKMETDHILPRDKGGGDDMDNAIPVCFECHAEIHAYNDRHPRGRKYTPGELRLHKEQWLRACRDRPEITLPVRRDDDVGPIQALVDELEYNSAVSRLRDQDRGALFLDQQFVRAIRKGLIAILKPELKKKVIEAYVGIRGANQWIRAEASADAQSFGSGAKVNRARQALKGLPEKLESAQEELVKFLRSDPE